MGISFYHTAAKHIAELLVMFYRNFSSTGFSTHICTHVDF